MNEDYNTPMFNLSDYPVEYYDSLKVNFLTNFKSWPPTTLGLLFEGAMNFGALIENEIITPSNAKEEELLDELYSFATEYLLSEVEDMAVSWTADSPNPEQLPFFIGKPTAEELLEGDDPNEELILINNDFYSPEEVLSDLDNPILTTLLCLGMLNHFSTTDIDEEELPKWTEAWRAVLITLKSYLLPEWKERFNQIDFE